MNIIQPLMGVQPMKYVFPVRAPCWPGVRPPQESPKLTGNSYCCSWNFLQQEVTVSCSDTCLMFAGRRSGVPRPETASSLSLDSSSGPPTEKPAATDALSTLRRRDTPPPSLGGHYLAAEKQRREGGAERKQEPRRHTRHFLVQRWPRKNHSRRWLSRASPL